MRRMQDELKAMRSEIVLEQIGLDLIQSAWGLSDAEFERVLQLEPGWLVNWRNHAHGDAEVAAVIWASMSSLVRFHHALRLVSRPGKYSDYLRQRWRADSVLCERSPLEAILAGGPETMNFLTKYIWSKAL